MEEEKNISTNENKKQVFATIESKIKEASKFKNEGNEHFKNADYISALKCYHKVILFANGLIPDDEYSKYQKKEDKLSEKDFKFVKNLIFTTHLNMTQIYLFQKKWEKALISSNKALYFEINIKGLYRRAIALIQLNDLDKAVIDLKKIQELDPNNAEIEKLWKELKEKQQKFDDDLKSKMKKMFI